MFSIGLMVPEILVIVMTIGAVNRSKGSLDLDVGDCFFKQLKS